MNYSIISGTLPTGIVKIPLFGQENIILLEGTYHVFVKINNKWVKPPFANQIYEENNVFYLIILYTESGLTTEYTYLFLFTDFTESDLTVAENKKKSKKVQATTEIKPIQNPPPAVANQGRKAQSGNNPQQQPKGNHAK